MASVHKLGNSLAAVIPAQAARQLGLRFKTQILVFVSESEIRIRNASAPVTEHKHALPVKTRSVKDQEEPW
jgi:antitoxin component of MazEF toxin-antitoxin module